MWFPISFLALFSLFTPYTIASQARVPNTESSSEIIKREIPQCHKGAYIIIARNFFEQYGQSALYEVARFITDAIPDSVIVELQYPAAEVKRGDWDIKHNQDEWYDSQSKGTGAAYGLVGAYQNTCLFGGYDDHGCLTNMEFKPTIVLLGFGSGAAVVSRIIERSHLGERGILAAATFGDPRRLDDRSYNRGSARGKSVLEKEHMVHAPHRLYGNFLVRDYCDDGDVFCDSGSSWRAHNQVVHKYAREAADVIIGNFHNGPFDTCKK